MIDWNDNAMNAIHKFYEYLDEQGISYANKEGCIREFFDWLPQTKTVADAVEQKQPHFKATRENLEKIAKDAQGDFVDVEQEGEEWTHIDAFGAPCRILIEEKDKLGYVVILRQSGHYATPAASSLKPIKPEITKEVLEVLDDFKSYAMYNNGIGVNNLVALYLKDRFNIVSENKRGD